MSAINKTFMPWGDKVIVCHDARERDLARLCVLSMELEHLRRSTPRPFTVADAHVMAMRGVAISDIFQRVNPAVNVEEVVALKASAKILEDVECEARPIIESAATPA